MSNKAKALDWTRRLVATYKDNKPNAIAYSLDDFSQKNFYRWKEDDTVVGKYDGYLFVENETIESERDVVELPFAASDQFSDVAKIPIYSYDEEGNLEYNSVEPRLLAYNGVKGVFTGLDWNTLLSMYYQTYQSIIRRPIVITEKIEINDIELRDLDMTVPIYLPNMVDIMPLFPLRQKIREYVNVNCYNWRCSYGKCGRENIRD